MDTTCTHCGNMFSAGRRGRKYCSHPCASAARVGSSIASKGKARPHTCRAAVRSCKRCGTEFRATADFAGRQQQYCGVTCWRADRAIPEVDCLGCQQRFKPARRNQVYCGESCRDAHYRVRFQGEGSHLWEGGKTSASKRLRTSAAYREWRAAVFKRDDYQCVECGARSGNGVHVELHADHVKPLSEFPELALDVANGRTLCRPCHEKTDTWAWRQAKRMREKSSDALR